MKQIFGFTIVVLFFWISGCESTTNSSQQKQDTTKVEVLPDSTLVEELPDSGKVLDRYSGDTWRKLDFPSQLTGYFWSSPKGATVELFKTTDGGLSWRPLNYPGGASVVRFINDNIGLISGSGLKIWRTIDGGNSWEMFNSPLAANEFFAEDIRFDPSNLSHVWMLGPRKLYSSQDTGRTWNTIVLPDTGNIRGRSIVFTSSLNGWLLCDGRVYKTINGIDWTRLQNVPAEFDGIGWSLDAVADGAVVMSTSNGTFKTLDGGAGWQKISDRGNDDDISIAVKSNMQYWTASSDGKIFNTTDGGVTWKKQFSNSTKTPFLNYIKFFDLSNGIAMGDPAIDSLSNPTSPTLFVYTTNGGATWIQRIPKIKN